MPKNGDGGVAEIELRRHPVLVVDDEPENLELIQLNFGERFDIRTAESGDKALERLQEGRIAVALVDQRMPGMSGIELLEKAKEVSPDTVGVIVTAYTNVQLLLDSINRGEIYRYVTKPWDPDELFGVLRNAIERYHLRMENRRLLAELRQVNEYLKGEVRDAYNSDDIVGIRAGLSAVFEQLRKVSATGTTVLVQGESGTGKELVARAIHAHSPRRERSFIKMNCAAFSPGVLESELFGHEKGAFTGASRRRAGRFELAHRGTLFLDEIGDLPSELQVKLLRVLQEYEFERVGGNETIKVDVRVIAATHQDLLRRIEEGTFREDLYFRLNVFPIKIPPLRERPADLLPLAKHFIQKANRKTGKRVAGISDEAADRLVTYHWPGNVRELENVIERAVILAQGPVLGIAELGLQVLSKAPRRQPTERSEPSLPEVLDHIERDRLVMALEKAKWRKADAARILGINRSTLYYRLKKYGLLD